jgi:hypothetical protein
MRASIFCSFAINSFRSTNLGDAGSASKRAGAAGAFAVGRTCGSCGQICRKTLVGIAYASLFS